MASERFIHALLLFLGLFLKISRWVPLFTDSYYFKYANYCFPFLMIRMIADITKIISHKLRSMSFITSVAKNKYFWPWISTVFPSGNQTDFDGQLWNGVENWPKHAVSNRKKVVLAQVTPPNFFSMSQALAFTIQIFFRTAIWREYWTSVVDSHTNTVISHPDACIVFIIFLVIHCCKHHNCCLGLIQVLMFRRRGGGYGHRCGIWIPPLRSPLASSTRSCSGTFWELLLFGATFDFGGNLIKF